MSDILTVDELTDLRERYWEAARQIAVRKGMIAGIDMQITELDQQARDLRTEVDSLEMLQSERMGKVITHIVAVSLKPWGYTGTPRNPE